MTDQEKIIAYDLDAAGIEERAKVCVDLVQTKAELAEAIEIIESAKRSLRVAVSALSKIDDICSEAMGWGDDDHGYCDRIQDIVIDCFGSIGRK
jgi:hypothetical protein